MSGFTILKAIEKPLLEFTKGNQSTATKIGTKCLKLVFENVSPFARITVIRFNGCFSAKWHPRHIYLVYELIVA